MGKDTIRALDTRQQCREKLPVFFGSRDNFIHGFKEVMANSSDEINNNFENGVIEVELFEDCQIISVKDSGRGIPINEYTDGVPNYVLLFETLFAGTNYDNNENGKITTGTNGCGTCVLNHTSELFQVTVARDGKIFDLVYEDGATNREFDILDNQNKDEHYTMVTFKLDSEVYTNTVYDPNVIKEICKYNAAVNNKITIKFTHNDEFIEYHYDSINDYFEEITDSLTSIVITAPFKIFEEENERNQVFFSLASSSNPVQQTFLNSNYLPEHGTIYDGIINGVRTFVNSYCKENKLIDNKTGLITKDDIEESISFIGVINSTNVEYENQIKLATKKELYKNIIQKYVKSTLEVTKIEQPKEFEKLVKHILEVQKFNSKAQAAKKNLKKKLSEKIDSISNRIEGLVDCKLHGEESELYIAEGRSALGSIVLARNPKTQAAIPIRGKILNCLKADYITIFKNEIVSDIIKALGCGIETDKKNKDLGEFNIKGLRYGKIMLATDMDADGYNIQCLLLTMLYRLVPTLIHQGRVYLVMTPLYEVKLKNGEIIYWFSETERNEAINSGLEIKNISRAKGLGELDAEVMAETGINPETRHVIQVKVEDVIKMQESFRIWMDNDVTDRKKIIETELNRCKDID